MTKLIHIEDSRSVHKQVKDAIDDWFGLENVEIENLDFEKAAANFIESNKPVGAALIIVDLMVAYQEDENASVPDEVLRNGSFDAGFRLIQKLQASETWRAVPALIYSSVSKELVENRLAELGLGALKVFEKSGTLKPLLEEIQTITGLPIVER